MNEPDGLEPWFAAMDRTLGWLYSELVAPLDAALRRWGTRHLRIIPHRALHLVPFAALFREDAGGTRHYLVDDYDFTYSPSATLHAICRQRAADRTPGQGLTALANPTGDLRFAEVEIEHLSELFPAAVVDVRRRDAAGREALTRATPGAIVHIAGHGSYDWDDPLASALRLAHGDRLSLADLFAEQVRLPQTRLVVLSACETGLVDPEDLADEYLGLASGFLFAGTPAVVSTLWLVDDLSTALLMRKFYELHLRGDTESGEGLLPPARALQRAQRWLRDATAGELGLAELYERLYRLSGRRDRQLYDAMRHWQAHPTVKPFWHPYFWAAFTFNGV